MEDNARYSRLIFVTRVPCGGATKVSAGFWPVLLLILVVIAWVISKVVFYAKKSEQQWQAADKSKIKEWQDEEW